MLVALLFLLRDGPRCMSLGRLFPITQKTPLALRPASCEKAPLSTSRRRPSLGVWNSSKLLQISVIVPAFELHHYLRLVQFLCRNNLFAYLIYTFCLRTWFTLQFAWTSIHATHLSLLQHSSQQFNDRNHHPLPYSPRNPPG